jgi:chaperone modulatory protein CbpM
MVKENYIPATEFCSVHNLCYSFINSLGEYRLVEPVTIGDDQFIKASQLLQLQHISRLHHELDVNLEGIYIITHLLQRIKTLQAEIDLYKKRQTLNAAFSQVQTRD